MKITENDLSYTYKDMEEEMRGALGSVVSKYGIEDDLIHMCLLYPFPEDCTDFNTFLGCPPQVWIRDYVEMEDKHFYQNATVFARDFSSVLKEVEKDFGLENHSIIPENILITQLAKAAIWCVVNYVNDMLADPNAFITCLPRRTEWEKEALHRAIRDYMDKYPFGNHCRISDDYGEKEPYIRLDISNCAMESDRGALYWWLPEEPPDDVPF